MTLHILSRQNTVLNKFIAQIRDKAVQRDSMRFRRNMERIGEIMAYEISKEFTYRPQIVTTPLGEASVETIGNEIVLATKVHFPTGEGRNCRGLSRKEILYEVDQSLKRLGTDYIDLYTIHRWDSDTPIEETMDALNDVVKSGKVLYLGASSMGAWQFAKAQHAAEKYGWTKFVTMQNLYNLIYREEERDMIPLCRDMGVGLTPWSPNAKGRLVRKPGTVTRRYDNEAVGKRFFPLEDQSDLEIIRRVEELAGKRGVPMIQISLAWLLSKPVVTAPILGATKLNHLEEAVIGLDNVKLTEEETRYLEEPYTAHNVVGF